MIDLISNKIRFDDEGDVRRAVRELGGALLYWIEPSAGSTNGLPDCFYMRNGITIFMELKCGHFAKNELRFTVRPAQRRFARAALLAAVSVQFVVGVRSTRTGYILPTNEVTLSGRVPIADLPKPWGL